jgi:RimJ/RimL family protein N-acetyltransferase
MTSAGTELLRAAKASAAPGQPTLSLAIGRPVVGLLRPVSTRPGRTSPADVRVLTDWRNRHVKSFLTEFVASEERTERWLVESVGPDDTRILFMVEDATGRTVGYMGLAFIDWASGYVEFDAIVRGAEAPPGLMSRSLRTMCSWGRSALGLELVCGRVRSDNPALAFFEKLGVREHRRVPLRREEHGGEVRWVEDPSVEAGGLTLVHMKLEDDGGG